MGWMELGMDVDQDGCLSIASLIGIDSTVLGVLHDGRVGRASAGGQMM
jgi:hypothetical protein